MIDALLVHHQQDHVGVGAADLETHAAAFDPDAAWRAPLRCYTCETARKVSEAGLAAYAA